MRNSLVFLLLCFSSWASSNETVETFKEQFRAKRLLQLDAIKRILELDVEKQERLLSSMAEKIFGVMASKRSDLESSNYIVGGDFPEDIPTRETLALLMENTCLIGDMFLRFPDYMHARLQANREWDTLYKWCVGFVQETKLLDDSAVKLMHLVSQELGLVEKDPNYKNPYKQTKKKTPKFADLPPPKKKEKKKIKKGPRMSKVEL